MNQSDFVHLHLHTEYSLLDGAIRLTNLDGSPSNIFKLAERYNMKAMAITDHGNMYGVIEFYKVCQNMGMKPIIGCEVYVAPASRFNKKASHISETNHHLTLLCKNEEGYKNLMKLVSIGYVEGFYYKPRVDKESLKKYNKGLIALSGCMKGEIAQKLLDNKEADAEKVLEEYLDIFTKDDFYLELQDHNISDQKRLNEKLIALSKKTGVKPVATNDCHYPEKKDAYLQEILLCIGTGKTLDDTKRLKFSSDEFYFKSPQEMKQIFQDIPEAVTNTVEIAEKCNLELDFSKIHLPVYEVPEKFTFDSYLEHLCREGLQNRYPVITDVIEKRLVHELKIIEQMGYSGYFLIVWDFIRFARENNIPVGPGRGSGAGSIVSYLLKITDVDPLKYGLIFERFLNPDRKTMPDLDIDFSDDGRERVIKYVKDKYGNKNVAQIVTFGSMLARLAVRDVGRVLNIPIGEVDKLAKLLPFGMSLFEARKTSKELAKALSDNETYNHLFNTAMSIEGIKRHIGVHAAGIVIAKDDMTNYVPFTKSNKDVITTQYEGESLVQMGLLKMDFLGLRNLSVIDNTVRMLKKTKNIDLDIENLPLDDEVTYNLLQNAQAIGVFQMESSGMRDLLRKIKPTNLEDLIALIALYRPGPMGSGMLDDYVNRKHGKSNIKYDHPFLEPILEETYGVILYQEQVMRMAVVLAGFSESKADTLRKAMGKKIPEILEKERENFINGAKNNKIKEKIADKIFNNIVKFGGYGFNKSHSTAYGLVAYRTAFLKANYPVEYMTALLNSDLGNTDKISQYVAECKVMGITVLPPDIQKSFVKFSIENDVENKTIRFGLLALKNVGEAAIKSLVKARDGNEDFKSFTDFLRKVDLRTANRKVVESLIKSGAFDSLNYKRAVLMEGLDKLMVNISKASRDMSAGQTSFLDNIDKELNLKEELPKVKEWHEHTFLTYEKEAVGFYISGHPLAHLEKEIKHFASVSLGSLDKIASQEEITVGGILTYLRKVKTRKGSFMAVGKLEDTEGEIEVLFFPKVYKDNNVENLAVDNVLIIKGKIDNKDDEKKFIAEKVVHFADAKTRLTKKFILQINTAGFEDYKLSELNEIFKEFQGRTQLVFDLVTPLHGYIRIDSKKFISITPILEEKIKKLLGNDSISYLV